MVLSITTDTDFIEHSEEEIRKWLMAGESQAFLDFFPNGESVGDTFVFMQTSLTILRPRDQHRFFKVVKKRFPNIKNLTDIDQYPDDMNHLINTFAAGLHDKLQPYDESLLQALVSFVDNSEKQLDE